MPAFNITIIGRQSERSISKAFEDIAQLLQSTLTTLGHGCSVSHGQFESDRTNIVLGYHLLPDAEPIRRHPSIIYQLEHLPNQQQEWVKLDETRSQILASAEAIWDFSPDNIAYLDAHGIGGVRHVPFGFHSDMERVKDSAPEIDVLFYGAISKRRKAVLDRLSERCRVKTLFGVYGARRDELIGKSQVVLNFHFGPTTIQEQPRIVYLLNNRRFVLAEKSSDDTFGEALVSVAYDEIADSCLHYLAAPELRAHMAELGYEALRRRPMTESIARALDERGIR